MKKTLFTILCLGVLGLSASFSVFAATEESESAYYQENVVEFLDEEGQSLIDSVSGDSIADAFSTAFSESGTAMIVALVIITLLIVIIFKSSKKKSGMQNVKEEISGYIKSSEPHKYNGNVRILPEGISYSRGSRNIIFSIKVDKNTVLAPFMVDDWFANRNYNQREAVLILEDISWYLKENGFCKSVSIISDEEFEDANKANPD